MAVSGVGNDQEGTVINGLRVNSKVSSAKGTLDMDSFMKLMAAQLQNQDMSNPLDNSEMMAQMTQMATVQAMNTFTDLATTQYALSMVGKEVKVADSSTGKMKYKTGIVSGINLSGTEGPKIYLEGESTPYGTGNIMEVGKITKEDPDDDSVKDPEEPGEDVNDPEEPGENSGNGTDGPGGTNEGTAAAAYSPSTGKTTAGNTAPSSPADSKWASYGESEDIDNLPEDKAEYYSRQTMPSDKQAALAEDSRGIPSDKLAAMSNTVPRRVSGISDSSVKGYGPGYLT